MGRNILFFHEEFPSGGGERVTRDIARSIAASGYKSYVAVCKKKPGDAPEVTLLNLPDSTTKSQKNADEIIHLIHTLSIDIFVLPGFLWEWLAYVRERVSCRFIYILHNVPMWEVTAKLERRKRTEGSILKKLEWCFIAYPRFQWFKTYQKKFLQKYQETYDLVDAYVVLCDAYREEMIQLLGVSEKENKFCVIHNAEKFVGEVNADKKKHVIFVGNLIYENKRVDRLLDIWRLVEDKVPDWKLIIVGGGQELIALKKRAKKLNLQRVFFEGGSNEVQPYYDSASVSCLTSTFEGWPLCLTEAQANGVIPVAFNSCAGIQEILSPNGVNGLLVPPFNLEKFAEELCQLLTSPDRLALMRQNVIHKSKDYSLTIVGKKWLDLFGSL